MFADCIQEIRMTDQTRRKTGISQVGNEPKYPKQVVHLSI